MHILILLSRSESAFLFTLLGRSCKQILQSSIVKDLTFSEGKNPLQSKVCSSGFSPAALNQIPKALLSSFLLLGS